jgi:hypothetical protein
MLPWQRRPTEIANLFNPAFCGMVIKDAVTGYTEIQSDGMPYVLSFLILPIVLHTPTRVELPKNIRPLLHEWLGRHPQVKVEFPARVRRLAPFTREAILFAAQKVAITITLNGSIRSLQPSHRPLSWLEDAETHSCLDAAQLLGRWFASVGDISTIFRLWGVRP